MHIRKILMAATAGLAMSMLVALPVSAHGHHHQSRTDTAYPVCILEDCTEEGCHLHDGEYYCGYDHEDGYCDGSCRPVRRTVSRCGSGRRHGCH